MQEECRVNLCGVSIEKSPLALTLGLNFGTCGKEQGRVQKPEISEENHYGALI